MSAGAPRKAAVDMQLSFEIEKLTFEIKGLGAALILISESDACDGREEPALASFGVRIRDNAERIEALIAEGTAA